MQSARHKRFALRIAVVVCCLLVFTVFAWGLHAKLSLYDAHVVPSSATVAKLLTQKTGRDLVAPLVAPHSPDLRAFALCLSAALLLPLLRVLWLRPDIFFPHAKGAPCPPAILSRPPPAYASAR